MADRRPEKNQAQQGRAMRNVKVESRERGGRKGERSSREGEEPGYSIRRDCSGCRSLK